MDYREEYKKIADEKGYLYLDERDEVTAFGSDNGNKVRTEFCLIEKEDILFFAYDMFAPKAYMNNTYSGVYTTLDCSCDFECQIVRKGQSIMNFVIYSGSDKLGDKFIDKNIFIKTNNTEELKKHITKEVVENYIRLWDNSPLTPIKIVMGKGAEILPSLPKFKDKFLVGLQINPWVEPKELNNMIEQFSVFVKSVK